MLRAATILLTLGISLVAQGSGPAYSVAPEDPSFLYETRFIPGMPAEADSATSASAEKQIVVERIQADQKTEPISLKLSWMQVILIGGVLVLFILYRLQVNSRNPGRRY